MPPFAICLRNGVLDHRRDSEASGKKTKGIGCHQRQGLDPIGFFEQHSQDRPDRLLAFCDSMRIPIGPQAAPLGRLRRVLSEQAEVAGSLSGGLLRRCSAAALRAAVMRWREPKARTGPSIREFLRYYVLVLLRSKQLTSRCIIGKIKRESACNRDYRASGQLLVGKEDLSRVLEQLKKKNLASTAGANWRLTRQGRGKLRIYKRQQGQCPDGKERAAQLLLKWMDRCQPGQRVLDVGTGEGYLAFKVADKGCCAVGIDSGSFNYSKDSVRKARQKAEGRGGQVEFLRTSVTSIRGRNESFDYVITSQAIHCMKDQHRCVKAIYRLLKPGGSFLCMDFAVGLKGFLQHGWHAFLGISKEEWKVLLGQCGFEEPRFRRVCDYLVVMARKGSRAKQSVGGGKVKRSR